MECNLVDITRNKNGDYYFIYSIPGVKNHIKTGTKDRDEVLIVGVPHDRLVDFLKKEYPGSEAMLVELDMKGGK